MAPTAQATSSGSLTTRVNEGIVNQRECGARQRLLSRSKVTHDIFTFRATTMRRLFFTLLVSPLLMACTSTSRVSVARPADVIGLKSLGSIQSTVPLGGLFRNITYRMALNNCLKTAEGMGATHFLPDNDSGPTFLSFAETAHGTAYK